MCCRFGFFVVGLVLIYSFAGFLGLFMVICVTGNVEVTCFVLFISLLNVYLR